MSRKTGKRGESSGAPAADSSATAGTATRREEFGQGKAHVSHPEKVERRARDAASGKGGAPAPEGATPGGVSS